MSKYYRGYFGTVHQRYIVVVPMLHESQTHIQKHICSNLQAFFLFYRGLCLRYAWGTLLSLQYNELRSHLRSVKVTDSTSLSSVAYILKATENIPLIPQRQMRKATLPFSTAPALRLTTIYYQCIKRLSAVVETHSLWLALLQNALILRWKTRVGLMSLKYFLNEKSTI